MDHFVNRIWPYLCLIVLRILWRDVINPPLVVLIQAVSCTVLGPKREAKTKRVEAMTGAEMEVFRKME